MRICVTFPRNCSVYNHFNKWSVTKESFFLKNWNFQLRIWILFVIWKVALIDFLQIFCSKWRSEAFLQATMCLMCHICSAILKKEKLWITKLSFELLRRCYAAPPMSKMKNLVNKTFSFSKKWQKIAKICSNQRNYLQKSKQNWWVTNFKLIYVWVFCDRWY